MSRENDFYTRMIGDVTLLAILTGGVFKAETTGIEGISRDMASAPFDAAGYLKPCAMVRQRGKVPDAIIYDMDAQISSTSQIVEVWLYCDAVAGYTPIDAAITRLYQLFQFYQWSDTFPVEYVNLLDRMRDKGSLSGASMAKIDFQVRSMLTG